MRARAASSPAIPMVDFRVTVFDGSYHDVDSNELSFKMAGSLAFKDAMTRARPTILEPIMNVEVYAPIDFAGDLMGDLNGRRGRIAGMDTRGADDDHQGAGADVGDAHLRAAPHVGDRRPRLVSHGVLALRRGAGATCRRRSSRRQRRNGPAWRSKKCDGGSPYGWTEGPRRAEGRKPRAGGHAWSCDVRRDVAEPAS